jgi:hypothetical protein
MMVNHTVIRFFWKIFDNETNNHEKIKYLVEIDEGQFDEIITYNMLSNIVEQLHERVRP